MNELLIHIHKKRFALHALFWFIWIGLFTLLQSFGYGASEYRAWLFYYLVTLPLFMAHAYAVAYWLVPRYFFQNKYLLFSCFILGFLILSSMIELFLSNEIIWKMVKPGNIQQGHYLNWQNVLINGLGNEYIITVFLAIKVVRLRDSKVIEKTEMVSRKLSAEMELLHYQSYPRFVLHVMERLEQSAVKGAAQSSEMIIRLSNLMSHMIETRKAEKILLYKEIEMIKGYIDIQRMKLARELKVNVNVKGELNTIRIPSFLFFQLVEEGFSVMETEPEHSDYSLSIRINQNHIHFSMVLWTPEQFKAGFNPVVLENCQKYLNYFYVGNHKLKSNFEVNFVEITIEIDS